MPSSKTMSERDLFPKDRGEIKLALVKFGEDTKERMIPAVRTPDGSFYISTEVMASALIYMKRARAKGTAGNLDRSQYNGRRYEGGLKVLESNLGEVKEELDDINEKQPSNENGDWSLGVAVEVVDGKLRFYKNDFGVWRKLPFGSSLQC